MRPDVIDLSKPGIFAPIYLPLLVDDNRYKILYGGRDSAKSDFVASACLYDIITQDYSKLILLRRYHTSILQSQFQTLLKVIRRWNMVDDFHITTSPLQITYKHKPQNIIIAKGLDQPDNTKSIEDPTSLWIEEANQISEAAFIDSDLSLRSSLSDKITVWMTFNPEQEGSWINKSFFPSKESYEKEDGNFHWVNSIRPYTTILHTTYKDNPYCNMQRRFILESLKEQDENYYKVKTLGLWGGALKGLIYKNWKLVKEMPSGANICYGLDYGFNNPTAFVKVGFYDNETYVKQLIYETSLTHPEVANRIIKNWRNELQGKRIIVDSAAPELISVMKKAGLPAKPALKGKGSVYDGIMTVKRFPLNICTDSDDVIREAESYVWQRDKITDRAMDEPIDFDNHALDAVRYVLYTHGRKNWFTDPNKPNNTAPRERRQRSTFYD